jgi:gamma-glutamyl:cysteine ligase YbdK (ATP-grasp superfamily)
MTQPKLHLFEGFGIELEYAIINSTTLDVSPIADELLREVGGGYEMEVELGNVAWSNELALHVIEMKTNGPSPTLSGLGERFQTHVSRMNALLAPHGACLLPGAMHPWMDPARDLRLWKHENDLIYRTFDRIFNCKGHGWANLQSMHINLPFCGDEEFGRLHAAIRLVLPILPALAASSPMVDGRRHPHLNARLSYYRDNARNVPSVSGHVVPEAVFTKAEYESAILGRIYTDLEKLDPAGVLRHEWANARGAIARFDRDAIEIRVLDVQECPQADIAVAGAVSGVVRALAEERSCAFDTQCSFDERRLVAILDRCIEHAEAATIDDDEYIAALGHPGSGPVTAGAVWGHLIETCASAAPELPQWQAFFDVFVREGCLARRLARALGDDPSHARQRDVYQRLANNLATGELFSSMG